MYQVWVEGRVWQVMFITPGFPPLTWSQMDDIRAGFLEAIDTDWPVW